MQKRDTVTTLTKRKKFDKTWKVYFIKEGCSMLLFKNLMCWEAVKRTNNLKRLYSDWNGRFKVTK